MQTTPIVEHPIVEIPDEIIGLSDSDSMTKEEIAELKVYVEILNDAIASNSGKVLPNSGENHAAIMMSKFFSVTDKTVNMVVGQFSGKVSNKPTYLNALEKFLQKEDVNVKVLVLEKLNTASLAYNTLLEYKNQKGKNIRIESATMKAKDHLKQAFGAKEILHFAVFDNNKYRLEIVPKKYSALGCFNDSDRASQLLSIFNAAFDLSTE